MLVYTKLRPEPYETDNVSFEVIGGDKMVIIASCSLKNEKVEPAMDSIKFFAVNLINICI